MRLDNKLIYPIFIDTDELSTLQNLNLLQSLVYCLCCHLAVFLNMSADMGTGSKCGFGLTCFSWIGRLFYNNSVILRFQHRWTVHKHGQLTRFWCCVFFLHRPIFLKYKCGLMLLDTAGLYTTGYNISILLSECKFTPVVGCTVRWCNTPLIPVRLYLYRSAWQLGR